MTYNDFTSSRIKLLKTDWKSRGFTESECLQLLESPVKQAAVSLTTCLLVSCIRNSFSYVYCCFVMKEKNYTGHTSILQVTFYLKHTLMSLLTLSFDLHELNSSCFFYSIKRTALQKRNTIGLCVSQKCSKVFLTSPSSVSSLWGPSPSQVQSPLPQVQSLNPHHLGHLQLCITDGLDSNLYCLSLGLNDYINI